MADTEDGNHWKKPKGVLKAVNAFEKKYPKVSKGKHSTPRLRKVGTVAKAATILSEATRVKKENEFKEKSLKVSNEKLSTPRLRKVGNVAKAATILSHSTREEKESNDFKIINELEPKENLLTPRLRKVGHVAKAATILSEATREKKESKFNKDTTDNRNSNFLVSSASSNVSQRGILKNNKISRTMSNTVKFKQENEINSSLGRRGPKEAVLGRKLSSTGPVSPSPRTNKKTKEEEGYHSDCLSPVNGNKNKYKAGKKHRTVGRKATSNKRKTGKDKEESRESTEPNAESDSKEGGKDDILCLGRENIAIQKNKAQVLWRRLRTVVKLTRKMLFDSKPSLVLVSSDNKTSSAWSKMKYAIAATKMANKLLRIRREQRGQIPRGGGRRPQGSFDTLGKKNYTLLQPKENCFKIFIKFPELFNYIENC